MVQAGHALIAATLAFGCPKSTHPHLVVLTVPDESSLIQFFESLKAASVPVCCYREPDMQNQVTAIATAPLPRTHRRRFRGLPLARY